MCVCVCVHVCAWGSGCSPTQPSPPPDSHHAATGTASSAQRSTLHTALQRRKHATPTITSPPTYQHLDGTSSHPQLRPPPLPFRSPATVLHVPLQEVNERLQTASETRRRIGQACEEYRPVARRATLLYFLIAEFAGVNCMYQVRASGEERKNRKKGNREGQKNIQCANPATPQPQSVEAPHRCTTPAWQPSPSSPP